MHAAKEDKPDVTLMLECIHCSSDVLVTQVIVLRGNTFSRHVTVSVHVKRKHTDVTD
jgi:hypothetical protein